MKNAFLTSFVLAFSLVTHTESFSRTARRKHETDRLSKLTFLTASRRDHPERRRKFLRPSPWNDEWGQPIRIFARYAIVSLAATMLVCAPISSQAKALDQTSSLETWQLGNGLVKVANPTRLGNLILTNPDLLGSGGGGAVFAMSHNNLNRPDQSPPRVALKISWAGSAKSVANECRILQIMQQYEIPHVEQCLAMDVYPFGTDEQHPRIMIALSPVLENSKGMASIADLPTRAQQQSAVHDILETMVRMLAAGVVTTDVQLLIANDKDVAAVLFIDMTEAKSILDPSQDENSSTLSLVDSALANSFISEVLTLIPADDTASIRPIVTKTLQQIVDESGRKMNPSLENILMDQMP